eukprot:gene2308-2616_t
MVAATANASGSAVGEQPTSASGGSSRAPFAFGLSGATASQIPFADGVFVSAFSLEVRQREKHMVPLFVEARTSGTTAAMQSLEDWAVAAGGVGSPLCSNAPLPNVLAGKLPIDSNTGATADVCQAAADSSAGAAQPQETTGTAVGSRGTHQQRNLCQQQQDCSQQCASCHHQLLAPEQPAADDHSSLQKVILNGSSKLPGGTVACNKVNKRCLEPGCDTALGGTSSKCEGGTAGAKRRHTQPAAEDDDHSSCSSDSDGSGCHMAGPGGHPPTVPSTQDTQPASASNTTGAPAAWAEAKQAVDAAALQAQLPGKTALPGDYKSKGVPSAALWEQWEVAHGGKVVVLVHLKQSVKLSKMLPGGDWICQRLLSTRVESQWGDVSLTAAIMTAASDMLRSCPALQHLALASGQDVPVAALQLPLPPGVSLFGRFQFGAVYDAAASRVAAAQLQHELDMGAAEAAAWGEALTFHHTWMVLSRQLVLALLSREAEVLRVGRVLHRRFMQPDAAVAADEFLLVTAAVRAGNAHTHQQPHQQQTKSQRLTQAQSQPGYGVLLDCCPTLALFHPTETRHPHCWHNFTEQLECDVHTQQQEQDNKMTLLQALALAKPNEALFFRKVEVLRRMHQQKLLTACQLLWMGEQLPADIEMLS